MHAKNPDYTAYWGRYIGTKDLGHDMYWEKIRIVSCTCGWNVFFDIDDDPLYSTSAWANHLRKTRR